ncbi:methylated-DNA--[protein]-cysteine S-methyltransferase [Actinotalea sp. M2MS4P-6]|uniref:methylated-DNA--[protein]-cysteine S-methyltransferase n=1 Tax=Actinotalea sp. M2MS4P-6 TaxID=2983762 RepID=UPI0021E3A2ED|nr:methylated-DNA--[protein]-cysteine S-methyltransferase [Actinotalea sp. M2MS4P-6]MCV2394009.1 methylated-DNA--[protein]-cysteine S-methyltransferase [Actinotalea sp. M2MS4P-6]
MTSTTTEDLRTAVVLDAARAMAEAGGPLPTPELARLAGVSERTLRRAFTDLLGVGPRAFGQAVRTGAVRGLLRDGAPVTDALLGAGFGSVRAFYETAGETMGMPPSRYAAGAPGEQLGWTAVRTEVGVVLGVVSPRGLCAVRIGPEVGPLLDDVRAEFPGALLDRDDEGLSAIGAALGALAAGHPAPALPLDVRGTAFQARVWDALTRIPLGETRTYAELAVEVGRPTAVRAVAGACARNRLALVVPCHRVVRSDGGLGGYRWGLTVKRDLLAAEHAWTAEDDVEVAG